MGCAAAPPCGRTDERMWIFCCFVLLTLTTAVFGAPLDPETIMARAGTRLSLPCPGRSAVGDPLLVSWRCSDCGRGSGPVTMAEYSQDGTVSLLIDPGRVQLVRHSFQLVLDPTHISDTGTYVCRLNNSPTPDYIKVVVQDVPDAPGRPLVTGFTSTSVNISWAPSVNSRRTPVHHYVVQVREGEEGTWDLLGATVTPDNRTAFTVNELKPYTAYSFRVLGVNDLGQGAPSNNSYFMVTHRQLPSERPVIVSAHNISAERIEVTWLPPASLEAMNGEFLGYQLTYQPVTSDPSVWSEADLHGTDVTSFTIQGLEPYTEYELRLQYRNMLGLGEPSVVIVWTDEGEPSSPERLTSNEIGDTWVHLTWSRPTKPAAKITGYRVYYDTEDDNDRKQDGRIVERTDDIISYNLTGLTPYTQYRVWTVARSRRVEGRRSTPVQVRTDVSRPGTPAISNITCRGGSSVYVQWRRPLQLHGAVDFYLVQYRAEQRRQFEELVIPTAAGRQEETMFLPNLTLNMMYEVRVVAGTNSLYQPRVTYHGLPSQSHHVYVQPNCEAIQQQRLRGIVWRLSPGVVAGIACGAAALFLATLALVMWKKYFQAAYNHLDEQNKTPSVISTDWENDSPDGGGSPVPVHLFPKHVSRLHSDGDIGFSKEYEAIQTQTLLDGYTSVFSQETENKDKNRYLNIVAYDHTRVPLRPLPGQHRCDYVNANFIDGYEKPRAYIGTQGPLPDTYGTFWRMVWEQDVHIIVMITNLMERGRKKCDMYWPQEGSETHGVIKVTAGGEDVMATYTIRKFKLQHLKSKKPRRPATKTVYQYHYTNWPDHGIPENPLPILSFVRKSAAANRDGAGPIIVHCSAGVGRTGTYIVLDSMMRMIRTRGELNIFGFLKYIRTQRNFLVQTEDQYIFVHDALLEAIESGETDIHRSFLSRYLHNLQTTEQDIYPWYNLDRQFKLITYDQATDYDMTSARHPVNYRKNRSMELLPVESYRVCLTPRPGIDGSDYINASWLLGHSRLQEFIITQHPLVGTVSAFWQMMWDHNAQTAVLLSPVDDQEYCIFWPLEREEIACDQFRVRFTSERQQGPFVIRDFTLQSCTDDYEMPMRIIQCSDWPLNCTPIGHVFDLIKLVQRHHLEYQNGPCVVVDRFGGTEAATFCCLTTLMKQLEYESHADVYMFARLYHTRRPGMWRNQDDYLYLYRTVESLVSGAASPLPPAPSDATVAGIQNHLPLQQQQQQQQHSQHSQQLPQNQSQKLLQQSQQSLHSLQLHQSPQHQPQQPQQQPHQPQQQLKPILKNSTAGMQQYHAQQPAGTHLSRHSSMPLNGSSDDYVNPSPTSFVHHANGHVAGHGSGHAAGHGNSRPYRIPPDGRESTVLDLEHYVNS